MLSALATSHKVGIAVVAGVFIVFALTSSFLLPALRPQFPGRDGVRWFVAVTALITAGMLATIIALAAEPKESREAEAAPGTTSSQPASPAPGPAAPKGDPAAGKQLFSAQGCNSCHTFKPAGATGKVGPDLDKLASDAQKANQGSVEQYAAESIEDPNAYVVPGFPKGVMPAFKLSKQQVGDLVAFLTAGG
ncbi:MAG TPA: c-type cytochrome [Gaiellaceae bacterium]|nr:c-type cytochrome [Gaiellaceae bacterium]